MVWSIILCVVIAPAVAFLFWSYRFWEIIIEVGVFVFIMIYKIFLIALAALITCYFLYMVSTI